MTRIISHRGNLDGPNIFTENHPDQIRKVRTHFPIFDVEIDVYLTSENMTPVYQLGHDSPQYRITVEEMNKFLTVPSAIPSFNYWIHAKTVATILHLKSISNANIFYHTNEAAVETTFGFTWLYPGTEKQLIFEPTNRCVLVLPELTYGPNIKSWNVENYYAVCTDYPIRVKDYLDAKI